MQTKNWFYGSVSYQLINDRSANEDNTIIAYGYFVIDAALNYAKPKFEVGIAIENALNTTWNEAQFATLTRFRWEAGPVDELPYTPGIHFLQN